MMDSRRSSFSSFRIAGAVGLLIYCLIATARLAGCTTLYEVMLEGKIKTLRDVMSFGKPSKVSTLECQCTAKGQWDSFKWTYESGEPDTAALNSIFGRLALRMDAYHVKLEKKKAETKLYDRLKQLMIPEKKKWVQCMLRMFTKICCNGKDSTPQAPVITSTKDEAYQRIKSAIDSSPEVKASLDEFCSQEDGVDKLEKIK